MPELLTRPTDVLDGLLRQVGYGAREWAGQRDVAPLIFYADALRRSVGIPGLVLAVLGMVSLARRDWARATLLLAAPALCLLVMGRQKLLFVRFALPLMPFVAIFAAVGIAWLAERARPARRSAAFAVLLLIAILPPAADDVRMNALLGEVDTRVLAVQWLNENIPPGERLVAHSTAVPIGRTGGGDGLQRFDVHRVYSLSNPASLRNLACEGNRYVVLSSHDYDLHRVHADRGEPPTGYELLERDGQLLIELRPQISGPPIPYDVDDNAIPFWDLWRYARPGPTIRIYRLPRSGPIACDAAGDRQSAALPEPL
jgi:hypothetical protein